MVMAFAPRSRPVTTLLILLVAFGPASTDLYLPALPEIARALGSDAGAAQLTLSVFLVGFAVAMLAHGPLSDRFGRRPVLFGALAVYLCASTACASVQNASQSSHCGPTHSKLPRPPVMKAKRSSDPCGSRVRTPS